VVGLGHRVVDVDDVRVVELAGERRLGEERLVHHPLGVRIDLLGEQEHLDRHVALVERVACVVHAAGRARANFPDDRILADVLLQLELHGFALILVQAKVLGDGRSGSADEGEDVLQELGLLVGLAEERVHAELRRLGCGACRRCVRK